MKLKIALKSLNGMSTIQFMREVGYFVSPDKRSTENSFIRRIGRDDYPRFHIYTKQLQEHIIIDVHLDQKKSSYGGYTAHSGEYDGKVVEEEVNRLQSFL